MGRQYATLTDIFNRWGEQNVRDAANVDGDNPQSPPVTARINYFLQIASDEIEARLLGCAYKVPFSPIPNPIRTLCAELAYINMYRVRHSTDSTAPDPFMYVTARHNQIFADIHGRRFRLGTEDHTIDIPLIINGKKTTLNTSSPNDNMSGLTYVSTDDTLTGDGTADNPLSVTGFALAIDQVGYDVSGITDFSFVSVGSAGLVESTTANNKVVGIKAGNRVLTQGIIQNPAWNWQAGEFVMLGDNGLTQTADENGVLVRVGIALSPHHILLKLEYGFL
ncbi:MAG: DUF1320 domain-containing protein [Planctomycetaceae bacterium]|jgi:hypothetical protein|nr:DUF1320 domain-containing protein [Planctomycetaceae bacterium]